MIFLFCKINEHTWTYRDSGPSIILSVVATIALSSRVHASVGIGLPVTSHISVNVCPVGNRGFISILSRIIVGGTLNSRIYISKKKYYSHQLHRHARMRQRCPHPISPNTYNRRCPILAIVEYPISNRCHIHNISLRFTFHHRPRYALHPVTIAVVRRLYSNWLSALDCLPLDIIAQSMLVMDEWDLRRWYLRSVVL